MQLPQGGFNSQRGNEMEACVRFLDEKTVVVQSRSDSSDGSTAGDVCRELRAADSVWGYSYEQWREMGEGSHEIGPVKP
jgi:hypothetical protein